MIFTAGRVRMYYTLSTPVLSQYIVSTVLSLPRGLDQVALPKGWLGDSSLFAEGPNIYLTFKLLCKQWMWSHQISPKMIKITSHKGEPWDAFFEYFEQNWGGCDRNEVLTLYVLNFSEGTKTYIYIFCHSSTLIWHRYSKSFLKLRGGLTYSI